MTFAYGGSKKFLKIRRIQHIDTCTYSYISQRNIGMVYLFCIISEFTTSSALKSDGANISTLKYETRKKVNTKSQIMPHKENQYAQNFQFVNTENSKLFLLG